MAVWSDLLLKHFALRDEGIYSLIPLPKEPWVTVRHQQVRALNLALLIARDGEPAPTKVLVIGGGVAGMTFATAWRSLCPSAGRPWVRVLESREHPMNNLRGCKSRYLHPNLFTWPEEGWDDHDARLPFLNWSANYAHDVYDKLNEGRDLQVEVSTRCSMQSLTVKAEREIEAKWQEGSQDFSETFEVVVLALGPGVERRQPASSSDGYWLNDRIDQTAPEVQNRSREIVIAGLGDGGLTDFLRATINEFVDHAWLSSFADKIHAEAQVMREHRLRAREENGEEGASIYREQARTLLNREPKSISLRQEANVCLIGEREVAYANTTSFPINRLLTAMVLEKFDRGGSEHVIEYTRGRINRILRDDANQTEPSQWVLVHEVTSGEGIVLPPTHQNRINIARPADDVIARIGVEWTINEWSKNPPFVIEGVWSWPEMDHSRRLCLREPHVLHHGNPVGKPDRIKLGTDIDVGRHRRGHGNSIYWNTEGLLLSYRDTDGCSREHVVGEDDVVVVKLRNAVGVGFLDVVLCPRLPRYAKLKEPYDKDTHLAYRLWGALTSGYQRVILGESTGAEEEFLEEWMAASGRRRIDWGLCVDGGWTIVVTGDQYAGMAHELEIDLNAV